MREDVQGIVRTDKPGAGFPDGSDGSQNYPAKREIQFQPLLGLERALLEKGMTTHCIFVW